MVLEWEAAFGRVYQVQTSDDGQTWRTIWSTSNGDGGRDDLDVAGEGRHVRVLGTARGTGWGYSMWELQVYGN